MTITEETLKPLADDQLENVISWATDILKDRDEQISKRIAERAAKYGYQVGATVPGKRGRKKAKA